MVSLKSPAKGRIGIATSVAKAWGYDWQETLRLAEVMGLRLVQFYLPPAGQLNAHLQKLHNTLPAGWQVLFHLPANISGELPVYLRSLKKYFPGTMLIQHETYLDGQTAAAISDAGLIAAAENDAAPRSELFSFRHLLFSLFEKNRENLAAVLDVSRFYHQFYRRYPTEVITQEVLHVVQLLRQLRLPTVLHVIDHTSADARRSNWCPLFEGRLPWKEILQPQILQGVDLRYVIFEYETPATSSASIINLLNYFPETFTR